MPASSLVRAAFFALGAAVGGGAVAALNASKKKDSSSSSTAVTARSTGSNIPKQLPNLPVVDVGVTGEPRFSAGVATAGDLILKYGNPGTNANGWPSESHFLTVGGNRCFAQVPFQTNSCA